MKENFDILKYISSIHNCIELWANGLAVETHYKLQIIYEEIYELQKINKIVSRKEVEDFLRPRIIAIVSKSAEEQEELQGILKDWSKEYTKDEKVEVVGKKMFSWIWIGVISIFLLIWLCIPREEEKGTKKNTVYQEFISIFVSCYGSIREDLDTFEIGQLKTVLAVKSNADRIDFKDTKFANFNISIFNILIDLEENKLVFKPLKDNGIDSLKFSFESLSGDTLESHYVVEIKCDSSSAINDDISFPISYYQDYPHTDRTLARLVREGHKTHTFIDAHKHWIIALVGLLLSLIFIYLILVFRKKEIAKVKSCHPYFWKIKIDRKEDISLPQEIEQQIHHLRKNINTGRRDLNVDLTIKNMIAKAGFVDFQYSDKTMRSSYLFLINKESQSDHKAQFWDEIVSSLQAKDVNVITFYYNEDVRVCYNDQFENGLSLTELYNNYSKSNLVLIGSGKIFLNPTSNKLYPWTSSFEHWSTRYLLVWKNYYEWDIREKELTKLFTLLPAKLSSIPYLKNNSNDTYVNNYVPVFSEHLIDYFEQFKFEDLKIQFDSVQLDWIAACSLYNGLHFDLTNELGKVVYDYHSEVFSAYEQEVLFQLEWFSKGKFPKTIRTHLLTHINQDIELVERLRIHLLDVLKDVHLPDKSHAYYLHKESLLISEMLIKSERPTFIRRAEIRNELQEFSKFGVETDIEGTQLLKTNPVEKVRESIGNAMGHPSKLWGLLSIVPFILLCSFLWENFVHDVHCDESFGFIAPIKINDFLDTKIFTQLDRYQLLEQIEVCKIKNDEESDIIFMENLLRKKIFLGDTVGVLKAITDSIASLKSVQNITVDVLNVAMMENHYILKKKIKILKESGDEYEQALSLCKGIYYADRISTLQDSASTTYSYKDSLEIALGWCDQLEIGTTRCAEIVCINNGKCIDGRCKCSLGYVGKNCEIEMPTIDVSYYRVDKEKQNEFAKYLSDQNLIVLRSEQRNLKPKYIKNKNTIFYNQYKNKDAAIELGKILTDLMNEEFDVSMNPIILNDLNIKLNSYNIHLIGPHGRFLKSDEIILKPNPKVKTSKYNE